MNALGKIKEWLSSLTFRTGLYVGAACILFYIASFAQMLLPLSVSKKTILWVILYGMAKATQYSALLILGKEGIARLRRRMRRSA